MKRNVCTSQPHQSHLLRIFVTGVFLVSFLISARNASAAITGGTVPAAVVPINVAEAVIDPFWDPMLSQLDQWKVNDGSSHGLKVAQKWCYVMFGWASKPQAGPALRMSRTYNLDCSGYDQLIVTVGISQGAVVTLEAQTDRGLRKQTYAPAPSVKRELTLALQGATKLKRLTISMSSDVNRPQSGFLLWVGMANSKRLAMLDQQWAQMAKIPFDRYLQPESFEPTFKPRYELFLSLAELQGIRDKHNQYIKKGHKPVFSADRFRQYANPRELIGPFAAKANAQLFAREKDHGLRAYPLYDMAATALIIKDKPLLRRVAQAAIAWGLSEHWDVGFVMFFPGGTWDQRSFSQMSLAWHIAAALDMAGEMFTDTGREMLLRRLAQEGIGQMNFVTWRYDYIFNCNQLAAFSRGRIPAYTILEKNWPHAKPYTDLAYRELVESLNGIFLPDGGYGEGAHYSTYTLRSAVDAISVYARARHKPLKEVLPPVLARTGKFIEALLSTDEDFPGLIPISASQDRGGKMPMTLVYIMAEAAPDSGWALLRDMMVKQNNGRYNADLATWQMASGISDTSPTPANLIRLPDTALIASRRLVAGQIVKLLILGGLGGKGHRHEDAGSFVLEFAGNTFAMDPGGWNYSDTNSTVSRYAQRHNMLVPFVDAGNVRPAQTLPLPVKIIRVQGDGDDQRFEAQVNATAGWEPWYEKWDRQWQSPAPDRLTIIDNFKLKKGDGVDFIWLTQLPVSQDNGKILITAKRGQAIVTPPPDVKIFIEELPLRTSEKLTRIRFRYRGQQGQLVTEIHLVPTKR